MNLWAKSLGRLALMAVALFFLSCEDESSLLGYKNPRPKFKVSYVEIPVASSVLTIDSIVTDNIANTIDNDVSFDLIGQYNDPILGSLKAEAYLQLTPVSPTKIESNAVFDSLTFQAALNFYSYGFSGEQYMRFNVHQLTEPLSLDSLRRRYYYNSSVPYNPDAIGELKVLVNYDSLIKQRYAGRKDTLLTGRLDDAFGNYLFELGKTDAGSKFSDPYEFIQEVKGLVIIPKENNGMIGINTQSFLSKVTLHYHTIEGGNVVDTVRKAFLFSGRTFDAGYTRYTADRSATELAAITQPYQSYQPASGLRAVQSGSPLITKLDIGKFYEFADTADNIIINAAELLITNVETSEGLEPHPALILRLMNENDQFMNYKVASDVQSLQGYYLFNDYLRTGDRYFYVPSETDPSRPNIMTYDGNNHQFSGFITLFTQSLFKVSDQETARENRPRFLAVYPVTPAMPRGIHRTVFNGSNIKLRIYYTSPTAGSNNE